MHSSELPELPELPDGARCVRAAAAAAACAWRLAAAPAYHRAVFAASMNRATAIWSFLARTAGSTAGSAASSAARRPVDRPVRIEAARAASGWEGASSAAAVATPTRATLVAVTSRPDPIARARPLMAWCSFHSASLPGARPGARRRKDGFERERKPRFAQTVSERAFRTPRLPVGSDRPRPGWQDLEEMRVLLESSQQPSGAH